MRAGLRPPKVKAFEEWLELPSRLVYWQILLAIRFLPSNDPLSCRAGWMIANEAIYYTVVLCYCVILCSAVLIMMGNQHARGTLLEHSIIASKSFLIFGHVG